MDLWGDFKLERLDFTAFNDDISKIVENVVEDVYVDAVREAAYDTGNLAHSIRKEFTPGDWEAKVTVSANYWYFVEYGTGPHEITVRTKKVLSDGTSVFGKRVIHPGTRAQPFMRPALYKRRVLRRV